MNIYVGNMSYDTTEEDLRLACEAFGKVETINIIKGKYSGQPKGFGFVEIPSKTDGQSAIDGLNGRSLNVNEARPRTEDFGGRTGGYGESKGRYSSGNNSGYGSKGGYSGNNKSGYGSGKGGRGRIWNFPADS